MHINDKVKFILKEYHYDDKLKIYRKKIKSKKQLKEINLRKKVASKNYDNFL